MDKIFTISYLISLTLLIRVTFLNRSKYRFLLKIIACSHFLGLGIYSVLIRDVTLLEYLLLIGLIFSFIGDVFLGLKDSIKVGFILGVSSFSIAQLYYLLYFQMSYFNIIPFILSLVFMLIFWRYVRNNPRIEFPSKAYFLFVYIFLLSSTLFSSILNLIHYHNELNLILMLGCILFFISDITLFHVYFLKEKVSILKIIYLLFYHVAQLLIATFIFL